MEESKKGEETINTNDIWNIEIYIKNIIIFHLLKIIHNACVHLYICILNEVIQLELKKLFPAWAIDFPEKNSSTHEKPPLKLSVMGI